jgi:cytochrome b561
MAAVESDSRALPARHAAPVVVLHWTTAAILAIQYPLGWLSDIVEATGVGAGRFAVQLHMWLGLLLVPVVLLWLLAMLLFRTPAPLPGPRFVRLGARILQGLLLACVGVLAASGIFQRWAGTLDTSLFGYVILEGGSVTRWPLLTFAGGVHEIVANGLLVLVGLHAAAAVLHGVVGESALARMRLGTRP